MNNFYTGNTNIQNIRMNYALINKLLPYNLYLKIHFNDNLPPTAQYPKDYITWLCQSSTQAGSSKLFPVATQDLGGDASNFFSWGRGSTNSV
jgi:hypothetical protein